MAIISEKDAADLQAFFKEVLKDPVKMVFFKSISCQLCDDEEQLLKEVAELSDLVELEIKDLDADQDEAKSYKVENAPGLVFLNKDGDFTGVMYTGAPFGYEFTSVIESIKMISTGDTGLDEKVREEVKAVDQETHIKVFVTPSCPYCPRAVIIAHQFALENPNIIGEMIEAQEFMEMSQLYAVSAVPKIIINERIEFEGALPAKHFLEYLKEAVGV